MASLPLILVPAIDITVILPIYGHVAIKGDDVDQILSIYNPPFHSHSNLPDQTQWPLQIRQLKRSAKFWEGLSPSTTNKLVYLNGHQIEYFKGPIFILCWYVC